MLSIFSRRAQRSGSSLGTCSPELTEGSTTNADASKESTSYGPTLQVPGSMQLYPSVATLPQTRRMVVEQALNNLLSNAHFSICSIDNIATVMGVSRDTEAYRLLRTLHCMDYAKMSPQMRDALPHLINEALRPSHANNPATAVAMHGLYFGDEV